MAAINFVATAGGDAWIVQMWNCIDVTAMELSQIYLCIQIRNQFHVELLCSASVTFFFSEPYCIQKCVTVYDSGSIPHLKGGVTKPIARVLLFSIFSGYQYIGYLSNITFIFDKRHRSLAAVTPVWYERDSRYPTYTFAKWEIILNGESTERSFNKPHPSHNSRHTLFDGSGMRCAQGENDPRRAGLSSRKVLKFP